VKENSKYYFNILSPNSSRTMGAIRPMLSWSMKFLRSSLFVLPYLEIHSTMLSSTCVEPA